MQGGGAIILCDETSQPGLRHRVVRGAHAGDAVQADRDHAGRGGRVARPPQCGAARLRKCGALPGAVPALWRPVGLRPEARRRGDLPLYDHGNLTGCFDGIEKRLKVLLDRLFRRKYNRPARPGGAVLEGRHRRPANPPARAALPGGQRPAATRWATSRAPAESPSTRASSGRCRSRQRGQDHPGLVPAPAIPQQESFYFELHRESPGFANLLHTGQIAVFVAGAMPVAELEIVGLRPKEES